MLTTWRAAADQCVLAHVRNSLAPTQPSLRYQIQGADGALPTVEWLGPSPVSADDLLDRRSRARRARERAKAFLKAFLAGGPRPVRDIGLAAEEAGLSVRTVARAKRDLRISRRLLPTDGRPISYWLLPGQQLPGDGSHVELVMFGVCIPEPA